MNHNILFAKVWYLLGNHTCANQTTEDINKQANTSTYVTGRAKRTYKICLIFGL